MAVGSAGDDAMTTQAALSDHGSVIRTLTERWLDSAASDERR
ncbi:hypothetical protein AB0I10_29945 [Streptomyces sp. NPDC050636]